MKSLLVRRITTGASSLVSCALLLGAVKAQSQTTNVYVDPTQAWVGYMNWNPNPSDPPGDGGSGSSGWGTAALPAVFNGALLTLSPNVNTYSAGNTYWTNPDGSGANIMDANFYVQNDALGGDTVTFSGYCQTNTLSTNYTCTAFIKDFTPSYSVSASISIPFTNGLPFSITLATTAGDHIQYGFETVGLDANPATVSSLGVVTVSSNAVVTPLRTPTNSAPTPTAPQSSVLAMYNSSGVYTNVPVEDWLASWSGSGESAYTIPSTSRTVLEYESMSYAGVEFYDPYVSINMTATDYSINVTNYTTMHVDVWTPNANQFGIELVSLDNGGTQSAQVNFLPASQTIVSNTWIPLDIPLSQFTGITPTLDLSNLQQLLWIDNQGGGGAVNGNFYIDNVYFYSASSTPAPKLTASVNGSTVSLSFPTVAGYSYNVQYENNLSGTWQTLTTVTGDGTTHTVTDTAALSHRYYRIHP